MRWRRPHRKAVDLNTSPKRSRIQTEKRDRILDAALDVFSRHGYRGASIDEIAAGAGMSKPNLFYYYKRKEDILHAVLEGLLDHWIEPLKAIQPDRDPKEEIVRYIRRKVEIARDYPRESRLFANEIMRGAEHVEEILSVDVKALVDEKALLLQSWMDEGKIAQTDPHHLFFAIWAMTQHYADFDVQVRKLLGPDKGGDQRFEDAANSIENLVLLGILPRN